jgi:hypothetical protein
MTRRSILLACLTTACGFVFAAALAEVILRVVPIPGVQLLPLKHNELIGRGFYPNSRITYRNDRGEHYVHRINRWGFVSDDKEQAKQPGVFRIGFFGDSYTEALQVPSAATFFRQVDVALGDSVECLAFGHSGLGSVHSYLLSGKYSDFFDLDMIVYVFVDNDVGDNVREIKGDPNMPYAVLRRQEVQIDDSFIEDNAFRQSWFYGLQYYVCAHSVLMSTLKDRVKLLMEHGVKPRVEVADRLMATRAHRAMPDVNDLPSTWPDSLRTHSWNVAMAIIRQWRDEAQRQGREFVITYVPRPDGWETDASARDSWKGPLLAFCAEEHVAIVDPTAQFREARRKGDEVYYDHFTVEGSRRFAMAFVDWFRGDRARASLQIERDANPEGTP